MTLAGTLWCKSALDYILFSHFDSLGYRLAQSTLFRFRQLLEQLVLILEHIEQRLVKLAVLLRFIIYRGQLAAHACRQVSKLINCIVKRVTRYDFVAVVSHHEV